MIKNYTEILVDEIYNEMKDFIVNCDTEECEHDIKSMALNELPTAYFDSRVTEADKTAYLLDRQRRTTVLAKMAEVAEIACAGCPIK